MPRSTLKDKASGYVAQNGPTVHAEGFPINIPTFGRPIEICRIETGYICNRNIGIGSWSK